MRTEQQAIFANYHQLNSSLKARSDELDIIAGLQEVRVMLRALAETLPDEERLRLAHTFGQKLIESWWKSACKQQKVSLSLRRRPKGTQSYLLSETLEGMAELTGQLASNLKPEIAAYQVGLTYTYTLPATYRSSLGIYYTPPVLTERLINHSTAAGVDWTNCRVLDPACGGGAFLTSVAQHIIKQLQHCSPHILLKNIANRLRGYEIDPFGAWVAQVALDVVLLPLSAQTGKKTPNLVTLCNSLQRNPPKEQFDLVIGNPPYARTQLSSELRDKFKRSLFGHANLYGVFKDIALRHASDTGVIAFVTPTSFLAGEYFKKLRSLMGQEALPIQLDFVATRRGVFDDVLQETLLTTYKRDKRDKSVIVNELHLVGPNELTIHPLGKVALPNNSAMPWILPRSQKQVSTVKNLLHFKHRLADWGYTVSTGPLVWNRFKDQLHSRKAKGRLPLIWAESILPNGTFEWRFKKRNHEPWFEVRPKDNWLVCKKPCVLLQRTTAKEQHRRLIAAALPQAFLQTHEAVVIENHLNMLKPLGDTPIICPTTLAVFLNSSAADQAFRCVSGSVAVSAYELEALPLPSPDALKHLNELVLNNASHRELEDECQNIYLGN